MRAEEPIAQILEAVRTVPVEGTVPISEGAIARAAGPTGPTLVAARTVPVVGTVRTSERATVLAVARPSGLGRRNVPRQRNVPRRLSARPRLNARQRLSALLHSVPRIPAVHS